MESELIRNWLNNMYDTEIAEAKANADNEKSWSLGSPNQEAATIHYNNYLNIIAYIDVLQNLKSDIN